MFLPAALAAALLVGPAPAANDMRFTANWQHDWQHLTSGDLCQLTLEVGGYGEARFVGTRGSAPVFELQARRDMHASGPLQVWQYAPGWHPAAGARGPLGELAHIAGGGAVARGDVADRMLSALRQGMHLELAGQAGYDGQHTVLLDMTARNMGPALETFLDCARTDIEVAWHKMSRTRVAYEVDTHTLDEAGQRQLDALARFVAQDPAIATLYIDGHTDDSGTPRKNYQLSKRRAEAVAAYLKQAGLADRKFVVRYHGEVYPVADNDSAHGKAMNRRTTVRLAREDAADLAAK